MSDVAPELDALWKLPSRWAEAHCRRPRSPVRTAQGGAPRVRPRANHRVPRSIDLLKFRPRGRRVTAVSVSSEWVPRNVQRYRAMDGNPLNVHPNNLAPMPPVVRARQVNRFWDTARLRKYYG